MLSILKLNFKKLKQNTNIIIVMTILPLIMAYVMGSTQDGSYLPSIVFIDKDKTEYSKMAIEEIKEHKELKYEAMTYEEGVEQIKNNKIEVMVVLENGFGESINNNKDIKITVIKSKESRDIFVLENLLNDSISKTVGNIKIADITSKYIDKEEKFDDIYNNAREKWNYGNPFKVSRELVDGEQGKYDNLKYMLIGLSLFFSMYSIVFTIGDILKEKELKTWDRLMISPISYSSLLGGTFIFSYILGLMQISLTIFGGEFLFGLDLGNNIIGIFIVIICFVFVTTSIGLFLSSILRTNAQLNAVTPIVLTGTSMLGGCMWPLEMVNSKVILAAANLTPQKWAMESMQKVVMYGLNINEIVFPCFVLVLMGVVYFILSVKIMELK